MFHRKNITDAAFQERAKLLQTLMRPRVTGMRFLRTTSDVEGKNGVIFFQFETLLDAVTAMIDLTAPTLDYQVQFVSSL